MVVQLAADKRARPFADLKNEAETVNRYVAELTAQGVEAIVVLLHEGGVPTPFAGINAWADDVLHPDQLRPRLRIDAPLALKGITHDLVRGLDALGPPQHYHLYPYIEPFWMFGMHATAPLWAGLAVLLVAAPDAIPGLTIPDGGHMK